MSDQDNYGWRDPNYAAQTMFASHRGGMDYGGLGEPDLGYVTDLNAAEDQTFDPTTLDNMAGIPEGYGDSHRHPHEVPHNAYENPGEPMPEARATANPELHRAEPVYANPVQPRPRIRLPQQPVRSNGGDDWQGVAGATLELLGTGLGIWASGQEAKNNALNQSANAEADAAEADRLRAEAELEAAKAPPWGLIIGGGLVAVLATVGIVAYTKKQPKVRVQRRTPAGFPTM